jgi:hypothetical protein
MYGVKREIHTDCRDDLYEYKYVCALCSRILAQASVPHYSTVIGSIAGKVTTGFLSEIYRYTYLYSTVAFAKSPSFITLAGVLSGCRTAR